MSPVHFVLIKQDFTLDGKRRFKRKWGNGNCKMWRFPDLCWIYKLALLKKITTPFLSIPLTPDPRQLPRQTTALESSNCTPQVFRKSYNLLRPVFRKTSTWLRVSHLWDWVWEFTNVNRKLLFQDPESGSSNCRAGQHLLLHERRRWAVSLCFDCLPSQFLWQECSPAQA